MNGAKLQAIGSASVTASAAGAIFTFLEWSDLNIFQKIVKILFIWLGIVQAAFTLVLFILSLIGVFLSYIPLVGWIYNTIIYVVFVVGIGFGIVANIYAPKRYLEFVNNEFKGGLLEASRYM